MLDTIEMVGWLDVGAKTPAYYHTTNDCKLQLQPIVIGTEQEAIRKGMKLCPDCEKVMRNGSSQ